jgi:DNA-directed RNA polymerase subunit alpha
MVQGVVADVKEMVLANASFGPQEIEQIVAAIREDYANHAQLREAVQELESREDRSPAAAARLGVCYYLLGRYRLAIETLSKADGGAMSYYFLGKAQAALERYEDAIESYKSAKKAGYNADDCALATAEAHRSAGRLDQSLKVLDALSGAVEQTSEYLFQRGATVAALGGNPREVIALFERAVQVDGTHPGALFGLALQNDRYGNDDEALRLYQRAAGSYPAHVGSLMNLGLMYEDRDQFDQAAQCYQRVLEAYPDNGRARLFLRDASASGDMFYDEEAAKRRDRMAQVLSIPVTDFELSVRSRNCLQKMGVRTLGDLTRITEQELLNSKNFGETSLTEIRDMLASKGLDLGQFAHEKTEPEPVQFDTSHLSADEQAQLDRPIADLNLSVRARKCMVRLGLNTIGELLRKTPDDLLECKNFGVTSLNEVREKLTSMGLKLRND